MAMGSPPGLSSSSYMGLDNETEALMAAARALLKGVTLRCGITNIRSDCPPPDLRDANSTCASAGSGFAGLDPLDTDTLDQVSNTPWGGYYGPLPQKSVQGVTAFVLQYVAEQSGLNVKFYASRVPPAVLSSPDSTQPYMYMMYDQLFDCATFGVTFMYERAPFMRYSAPYLPYGFTAVGPRPFVVPVAYTDIMWTAFSAFTPECWGVVVASVAISAILHAILDSPAQREEEKASPKSSKAHNAGGAKEEDSGSKRGEGSGMTEAEAKEAEEARELSEEEEEMAQTAIGRVGVSFFQSAVSVSAHGFFSHHTPAASTYAWVKAVCYFLILAMYTANLAAYFTLAPQLVQPISAVEDFISSGVPACIGNRSNHIKFFQTFYPTLKLSIQPTWQAALDAVVAGKCVGAVGANFDLLDGMSPANDPTGAWCGLKLVGPTLGNFQYGLAFTNNRTQLPDEVVNAINVFVAQSVDSGELPQYASTVFSYDRPQCVLQDYLESSQSAVGWTAVTVQTLSGLAIALAAAVVFAALLGIFEKRVLDVCLRMQGARK